LLIIFAIGEEVSILSGIQTQYREEKEKLLHYARMLNDVGWSVATSGNISVRTKDNVIILTPSSIPYQTLKPEDLFELHPDGTLVPGKNTPTSSMRFHLEIMKNRPDCNAVIHAHSPYCIAASCVTKRVPPVTLNSRILIGNGIPVSPYAENGSDEEAAGIVATLGKMHNGLLMQNHGAVTIGEELEKAWLNMCYLEDCCKVWIFARSTGIEPSFVL
jgi:ribulose-5-phosphate 4-epimerase/fuculose-1-phosphate aldolase